MKKISLATLILISTLTLTACNGYETGSTVEDGAWIVVGNKGSYDVLKDAKTGCLYLQSFNDRSGITPYFDENGKVMGCGEKDYEQPKY